MNAMELRKVLEQHQLWLNGEGGKRADLRGVYLFHANLSYTDLSYADLSGADLSYADLSNADLSYADLSHADLSYADMSHVYLYHANLSYTDLFHADLSYTDLCGANMGYAMMRGVDLCGATLRGANLTNADLCGAKLDDAKYNCSTSFFALQCPEEGSFIGYKKACSHIVKLEILPDAKRSSATTRKCRCDAAKVISITTLDGKDDGTRVVSSDYDNRFEYRVGEIVRVYNFDENRWDECSTGIHFFITRDEAVNYN